MDFPTFVAEVRKDFEANQKVYLALAQGLLNKRLPGVSVVRVALAGSYQHGRIPREDSDVDLLVEYRGSANPEDVAHALSGMIHGYGGVFDIIATRIP